MRDASPSPEELEALEAELMAKPADFDRLRGAGEAAARHGAAVVPLLDRMLRDGRLPVTYGGGYLTGGLRGVGPAAIPLLKRIAGVDPWNPGEAVDLLAEVGSGADVREACLAAFDGGFTEGLHPVLGVAARLRDPELDGAILRGCLSPKKKRRVAFGWAAGLPEGPIHAQLRAHLASEDPGERLAAAEVLGRAGRHPDAAAAAEDLLARLGVEPVAEVRDAARAALKELGVPGRRIQAASPRRAPEELAAAAKKVRKLPGTFLDEAALPPLPGTDGEPLPAPMVRYLLHRQSKEPGPRPDVEALDVYDAVDRSASGDFAIHVLGAALAQNPTKRTAWVFIAAGVLGDRRVTAALSERLPGWIKKNKTALPEFAAAALGLVGDDLALSTLVGLADEHREASNHERRLLRDAAERGLADAATERGVPREELDEAVLPSFGFPLDGSARVIPAGKRTIEARVGADFKLALTDAGTKKRAASIPKAAGEGVQAEFKGLRKILQGVFKQQTRRLERLMVDGHAWDAGRWSERFLGHPVLVPYAQRLVWGVPEGGGYAALFRGLGDGTLTDVEDEPVERPAAGSVALAHPARMTPEQLEAWAEHAADYEVDPPFEQLLRFRAELPPGLADREADPRTDGGEVNGFSLRGKLQRHGWVLLGDRWTRRFAADAVTAVLPIKDGHDAYSMSREDVLTVGPLAFERDRRPLRLGEAPPVAYSEAAGLVLRTLGRPAQPAT